MEHMLSSNLLLSLLPGSTAGGHGVMLGHTGSGSTATSAGVNLGLREVGERADTRVQGTGGSANASVDVHLVTRLGRRGLDVLSELGNFLYRHKQYVGTLCSTNSCVTTLTELNSRINKIMCRPLNRFPNTFENKARLSLKETLHLVMCLSILM